MLDTNSSNAVDVNILYLKHRRRLDGIKSSKNLLDLMLAIQRHRAASLASLGGDLFFESTLCNIQATTTHHLATLSRNTEQLLTEKELRQLNGEWITIRRQWQKDSAMQNFLLHSHLINLILNINNSLSQRAGHNQLDDSHLALSSYCLHDLPRLIEAAAQARGLATHCTAQKTNSERMVARINFLIDEIQRLENKSQSTIVYGSAVNYRIIQHTRAENQCEHYLNIFLRQLKKYFSSTENPDLFPDEIYTTGSQFITATYDVLLRSYKLMSKSMDGGMKEWIYRSSYNSKAPP